MKARTLVLTLALSAIGAATALAQAPQMGTWKLDEGKSKVPANYMKNTTVTYEMAGDDIKVTTEGVDAKGNPLHTEWTGKFDGKDYPLTGDPNADARAYKLVNDNTLTLENKKDGKAVTSGRITVAADGKTRTIKVNGTDANGKKVTSTAVYTKQ